MQSKYAYTALSDAHDIRLLTLHRGSASDDLSVTIKHANLSDEIGYEALSYVWGSLDDCKAIHVDEFKTLSITSNLHSALNRLRRPDQERTLWVDAICIDQQNLSERAEQVTKMHAIYQKAKAVQIWIGPEADDSDYALEQLSEIGSAVQIVWSTSKRWILAPRMHTAYATKLADETQTLELTERCWKAFFRLFSRPWFERVWIRQEVHPANVAFFKSMLSRPFAGWTDPKVVIDDAPEPVYGMNGVAVILCGGFTLSWWNLRNAMTCFQIRFMMDKMAGQTRPQVQEVRFRMSLVDSLVQLHAYSWPRLIRDLRYTKCSDDRDRIYAVRGVMGPPDNRLVVQPDYHKSALEVFRDVVMSHIQTYESLDILRHCWSDDQSDSAHPTWIPQLKRDKLVHLGFGDSGGQFLASGHLHAPVQVVDDDGLDVTGVVLDTIDDLYQPFSTMEGSSEEQLSEARWQSLIPQFLGNNGLDDPCPGGGTYLDALAHLLTYRNFAELEDPPSELHPHRVAAEQILKLLINNRFAGKDTVSTHASEWEKLRTTIWATSAMNYGIFRSRQGYIGMAPWWTHRGDIAAILVGSELPFLLRPFRPNISESRSETLDYRIVAPCYIHGFMDGEALLGQLPDGISTVYNVSYLQQRFRDAQNGATSLRDSRILSIFSREEVEQYLRSVDAVSNSAASKPVLKVTVNRLNELGVNARLLRIH